MRVLRDLYARQTMNLDLIQQVIGCNVRLSTVGLSHV